MSKRIQLRTFTIKYTPKKNEHLRKQSAEDIEHFHNVFLEFEQEYHMECKSNLRNQIIIAEHKHEIDKLKEIINDAKLEL